MLLLDCEDNDSIFDWCFNYGDSNIGVYRWILKGESINSISFSYKSSNSEFLKDRSFLEGAIFSDDELLAFDCHGISPKRFLESHSEYSVTYGSYKFLIIVILLFYIYTSWSSWISIDSELTFSSSFYRSKNNSTIFFFFSLKVYAFAN